MVCGRFRFQFGAFHELPCEQPKLIAAPGAAAPDEANLSCRFMAEQRPGNEVSALKQAGIYVGRILKGAKPADIAYIVFELSFG